MSTEPDDTPEDSDDTELPLDERSTRNFVVGLAVVVEGGMIVVACLLGWWLEVWPLERLVFDWKGLVWGLAATLPMLAGFLLAVRWPIGPLRSIKEFTDHSIRPIVWPCSLLDLAGIALLAGLGEELLFRGFLQDAFVYQVGVWGAILGAAILFGLLHAVTPWYAVLAAAMGAYLGLVYHYSDNLLSAVIAHGLYDFVALVFVTRGPGSDALPAPEEREGTEGE